MRASVPGRSAHDQNASAFLGLRGLQREILTNRAQAVSMTVLQGWGHSNVYSVASCFGAAKGLSMRKRILLVVEPDPALQSLVYSTFTARGFSVVGVRSIQAAREAWLNHDPDLILIESHLPDGSGLDFLDEVRRVSNLPVIMMSAWASPEDRVDGLERGADDYVAKPFHLEELIARVKALLRRTCRVECSHLSVLQYDRITIDLRNRRVFVGGAEVRLSRTEWALLEQLARAPGRVIRHGELLSHVWGPEFARETYYLRTWISRLRAKLGDDEEPYRVIITRPGLGYQLAEPTVLSA